MMKRWSMMWLTFGLVGLIGLPVTVQGRGVSQAGQATLNELIAQYTLLNQEKQYAKAITVAQQALAQAERSLGPQDAEVAQILNDLGYFYQPQDNYVQAEPLHQRALAIREHVFHSDGPAVVQSLNNLAKCYQAEGQHAKAASFLKRLVDILKRDVSPSHPALREALALYAICLRAGGDEAAAKVVEAQLNAIHSSSDSGGGKRPEKK